MTSATGISNVLAALAVSDLDASVAWMTRVLGAPPSALPMEGLAEWYLDDHGGTIQVAVDAERAGGSMLTLAVDDIEATARRLNEAGLDFSFDDATSAKFQFGQLLDPDGNSIAIVHSK